MRKIIFCSAVTAVAACGGGGGGSGGAGPSNNTNPPPEKTELSVSVPSASTQIFPETTSYVVRLVGQNREVDQLIEDPDQGVTIEGLLPGDYTVEVTAILNDSIIGSGESTVALTASGGTIEVSLSIFEADLTVLPVFETDYSSLSGEYAGRVRATASCIDNDFIQNSGWSNVDVMLNITDSVITLEADIFSNLVIQMTGLIDDSSGQLTAGGEYQASDFTSGTWAIDAIKTPETGILFASLSLIDTEDCQTSMDIIGLQPIQ